MADAHERANVGMTAGLKKYAFSRVGQDDGQLRMRSAGGHVSRVLIVARGIGEDVLAFGRAEVAIRDINGDALLPFRAQTVGEKGELECVGGPLAHALELIVVDRVDVVEEAADQSGFSIVDAAGDENPQQGGHARSSPRVF